MCQALDLHIRILRLNGEKGKLGSAVFTCIPQLTRVADIKDWIAKKQSSDEVELIHKGNTMMIDSNLLEYDVQASPVIYAILTSMQEDKQVALLDFEQPILSVTGNMCFQTKKLQEGTTSEDEAVYCEDSYRHEEKKKLLLLKHRAGKERHQACQSTSIHIFALMACRAGAIRSDFFLDMGPMASCATVADIKKSVLLWTQEDPADVEVMLVSDRTTPLSDNHNFGQHGLPSELFVVISF